MRKYLLAALVGALMSGTASVAVADVDSTGAFNHSIDIEMPPAVGGVQPRIALSYNSQADNGLVGMGWQLEGFPAITRMSFGAGINYNAGDTYIGPDGRLVRFNGGPAYRSEEESWVNYVAYGCGGAVWSGGEGDGGPCLWKATAPDGTVMEFGGTEDSRIQALGRGGAIRVWALSKLTDTAGNFYTVTYDEDLAGGDYRPRLVTYNQGNGRAKFYTVELSYEGRRDAAVEFSQSSSVRANVRLKWIEVKGAGQTIRKYRLDYEHGSTTDVSRLTALQEYGRDGSTLPAQTFRWQEGVRGWSVYHKLHGWGPDTGHSDGDKYPLLMGDWNGDGKADLGRVHNGGIAFHISTGNGWQAYPDGPAWGQSSGYIDANIYPVLTGDWNGDGKTDIGRVHNGGIDFRISTGSGWQAYAADWDGGVHRGFSNASRYPIFIGDWNGDGKTDYGRVNNAGIFFRISTGTGWQGYPDGPSWGPNNGFTDSGTYPTLTGDWNGDGKTDIGRVHNNGTTFYVSTGSGWQPYADDWDGGPNRGFTDSNKYPILTGDWNGDGKTDFGRVNKAGIYFRISTGTGWQGYADGPAWGTNIGYIDANKFPIVTGDWDGDGKTDIGRVHHSGIDFRTSTGEGWQAFSAFSSWSPSIGYADARIYPMVSGDWTGEGKSGLGRVDNGGITFLTRAGAVPDLLTSITNELGGSSTITYQPATLVGNAVRPDLATPGVANASPTPLVTRVSVSDGRGATYSTLHEYGNARYLPGVPAVAENLGFEWTRQTDQQTNLVEVTFYHQDTPVHGRVKRTETRSPAGTLSQTETNYAIIPSPHATRLIRRIRETQLHYEFGAFKYRTATNYAFDAFGNATRASNLNDAATAADDLHQFSSYINDTSAWRIGLVSESHACVGTSNWTGEYWLASTGAVSCSQILQRSRNYYDGLELGQTGARGALTKSAAWRSDTDTWLETNQTYDDSGNLLTRTNPANIIEEINEYDPVSGSLIATRNAVGHRGVNVYDPTTGQLTAVTDANGQTFSTNFDAFGRRQRIETPYNDTMRSVVEESWSYSPNRHVTTIHTDSGQLVTTDYLDGLGRVWKTTKTWDNGSLLQTDTYFDAAGREYKTCAPHLSTHPVDESSCTIQHYDAAGRVVRVDAPRSGGGIATTSTAYDGYRGSVTDAAGNVVMTDYYPATRTNTLTQPGGLVTRTEKDVLGRVVRVTDPAGNVAITRYNSLGWKLSHSDPVRGQTSFGHNALGQIISQTDAAGQTLKMYYDGMARVVRTDHPPFDASSAGPEDIVFQYDHLSVAGDLANARGKLVRVRDRSGSVLFAYDDVGRVRTATKTVDGTQYVATSTYNRTGKRASVTYPDGSVVTYHYDTDAEHLSSITLDGVEVMRYGDYNVRGAPTSLTYGAHVNDISLTFESSTGKLLQQQDTRGFVNNLYAYDERGMLVEEQDLRTERPNGNTSKAFAYDALGQLQAAAMGSSATCGAASCTGDRWAKSYEYDKVGRILQKDARRFVYDDAKPFQLVRVGDEASDRSYDPVGRLLSKTAAEGVESYIYGVDGFLQEHRRNGTALHRMTYDYLGNRLKKEYLGPMSQTTWDLGNYKIVRDHASGKYFHTLYVLGLHGSRIAHRTTEKSGLVAASLWGPYQSRALASLYEPTSPSGFAPWLWHQSRATSVALLGDIDGARGAVAALGGLAMITCIGFLLSLCLWRLLSAVHAKIKGVRLPRRRTAWLAPAMLCASMAACVGKYEAPPAADTTATQLSDKKSGYGIMQAIKRDGTNQPVPGTFYYLNSPLGSTSVMFDAQGSSLLRMEYFPDGGVDMAASLGNYIATHTFGQKEYDKELELYYNAFRYYDSDTMRFTAPDAIKESSDFLVHNIYAYTRNNPVNYTDPTGFITHMRPDGVSGYKTPRRAAPAPVPRRTGVWASGPDGARPKAVARPAARPAARSAPPAGKRTGPWASGPDGAAPIKKYDGNNPSPGGPQYRHKFPYGMSARVPDGIRDAQAPEEYKHPVLSRIYDRLVSLYYSVGPSNMTVSYHEFQVKSDDVVVRTLTDPNGKFRIHTDMNIHPDDWSFEENMNNYRNKTNLVYSTADGIVTTGAPEYGNKSVLLHETLVAGVNYPIAAGASTTHTRILANGGSSRCEAALMCYESNPSEPMSPDSDSDSDSDSDRRQKSQKSQKGGSRPGGLGSLRGLPFFGGGRQLTW